MKRFSAVIFSLVVCLYSVQAQTVVVDSTTLGIGSANDVYYTIPTYSKESAPGNWDIAISVQPASIVPLEVLKSVTVRYNGGRNVKVMKITGGTASAFNNTFNPSTDSAAWMMLYDDMTNWDLGAFNTTLDAANAFDFGWGEYDQSTHNVEADSIYAVRTVNGTWKKLWIEKLAFDTTWHIKVANMDGSAYQEFNIAKSDYPGKNFVYVSLDDNTVLDNEPGDWDMLFTKYQDYVCVPGLGCAWYAVNGVLTNKGVTAVKAYPVDVNTVDAADYTASLSGSISTIGWDWKTFVTGSGYVMEDSTVYFVKALDNNVYRLRFLSYESSDATTVFELSTTNAVVSIENKSKESSIALYPNPAADRMTVIDFDMADLRYRVLDAPGKLILHGELAGNAANQLNVSGLTNGLYHIQLIKANSVETKSFVVNR